MEAQVSSLPNWTGNYDILHEKLVLAGLELKGNDSSPLSVIFRLLWDFLFITFL